MDIKLPEKPNNDQEILNDPNTIVIIGANGSGKTRLGVWIEEQYIEKTHRISAQKSLSMPEEVNTTSIEAAKKDFYYGNSSNENLDWLKTTGKIRFRWGKKPSTYLLNDYEKLMVLLHTEEYQKSVEFKDKYSKEKDMDKPITKLDIIKKVWEKVLPHRKLIKNAGVIEATSQDNSELYNASNMSDGERIIFYYIGEVLCTKENSIIIIDEPEMHLHKSIVKKLWDEIEILRPDCIFIYLTHDIDFAITRTNSKKIWVKSYEGNDQWNYEIINDTEYLPEQVYLEILGSRKPILFVEGDNSSFDYKLYQYVYTDYNIVPLGSSNKVFEATKIFNNIDNLHHINAIGIIDRDRRTETEIQEIKSTCENIFLIESVVILIAQKMYKNPNKIFDKVKNNVFQFFEREFENQVIQHTKYRIRRKLENSFDSKVNNYAELEEEYLNFTNDIDIKKTYEKIDNDFRKMLDDKNFDEILKVFNNKGLIYEAKIANLCGLNPNKIHDYIQSLFKEKSNSVEEVNRNIKQYII